MKKRSIRIRRVLVIGILILTVSSNLLVTAQSDMSVIKERIINELLETEIEDQTISTLLGTLQDDGTWPGINYEDVSRTSYEHGIHIGNLVSLCMAYKNPTSSYYESDELKNVFTKAIDFWNKHDFIADNWHTKPAAPHSPGTSQTLRAAASSGSHFVGPAKFQLRP